MLTKDLVRYALKGTQVKPEFIDPANAELLRLAENLLGVFRFAAGKTRSQLEEECKILIDAAPSSGVLSRGFEKLLLDRVEFRTTPDEDLLAWRHQLFLDSTRLLAGEPFESIASYRQAAAENTDQTADEIAARLFSDLPENQPVEKFRSFSAERLLHRYNCALVQWLLLHSNALTISTRHQDTKAWRQFFRHLRFHQLLAEIHRTKSGVCKVRVDGPLSLFQQTKKYGLSLATFFPAVLHLPEWKLEAEIHLRNRKPKRLVLDQTSGLRPYSGHFLAHIPAEITLFEKLFQKQESDWTLTSAETFVVLPGDAYGFPDFTLRHPAGREIAIELFHPWHAGPLKQRLQQLEGLAKPSLLIGVDRKLAKDPTTSSQLEESRYFQDWGFLFRDMPSPKSVMALLANLEPA